MAEEIPLADRLTSIINVDIPVGNSDGFEVKKPFEDGIPSDSKEVAKARALIMLGSEKTNALINSMVSEDGRETWIFLSLLPFEGKVFEEEFEGDKDAAALTIGYKLMEIIESEEFKSDKFKLYGSGIPYDDANEDRYDIPEYELRVAIGFVVMLIFLAIFLRNVFGVLVPAITTIGAITSVLGGMSYFGVRADSNLVTLPILLGMALTIGYSIHYINMFKLIFRRTGKRKASAALCVGECGWAVLFTVLTTMASFVSFLFVDLNSLAWLGKTAALIVLTVYVYVAVLIPILLSFGKDSEPDISNELGATKLDMLFFHWASYVQRKRLF